jgi:putative tricarboxylic transport membrane protein
MDRRIDMAISAVFVALGVFVILEARTIKSGLFTDPIGPRAFFYFCAIVFIIGGLMNIAQRALAWNTFPGHLIPAEGVEDEPGHPSSYKRAMLLALLSLAYILTFRPLGYLIATPLYVFAGLWLLDQRNWRLNVAVALVFTTTFYLIFARLLGVWLPVGPFTTLFRDLGWITL